MEEQSYLAISSLVISILIALKVFITDIHLKKCHACCIDSDCSNGSISRSSSNNNSRTTLDPLIVVNK